MGCEGAVARIDLETKQKMQVRARAQSHEHQRSFVFVYWYIENLRYGIETLRYGVLDPRRRQRQRDGVEQHSVASYRTSLPLAIALRDACGTAFSYGAMQWAVL